MYHASPNQACNLRPQNGHVDPFTPKNHTQTATNPQKIESPFRIFFSKIWNPYGPIESHSPASFPEVSISRLRTASKIENITAMKNRSLPVIRCCAELTREIRFCLPNLMFPHGPHDELAECPNQSAGSQIRTDLKPSEP